MPEKNDKHFCSEVIQLTLTEGPSNEQLLKSYESKTPVQFRELIGIYPRVFGVVITRMEQESGDGTSWNFEGLTKEADHVSGWFNNDSKGPTPFTGFIKRPAVRGADAAVVGREWTTVPDLFSRDEEVPQVVPTAKEIFEQDGLFVGPYIALDWYDGPLLEVAAVHKQEKPYMVQVKAHLVMQVEGEYPWHKVTVRFSRSEVQAMMDLLDGKQVKDYSEG